MFSLQFMLLCHSMEFTLLLGVHGETLQGFTRALNLLDDTFVELCPELIELRVRPVMADIIRLSFQFVEHLFNLTAYLLEALGVCLHLGDVSH